MVALQQSGAIASEAQPGSQPDLREEPRRPVTSTLGPFPMTRFRLSWLLLLPLLAYGCLPYTSVSLAIIDSTDVQADVTRTVGILRSLGFVEAAVSSSAPPGALGFRAYQGQFTVVAPDPEKHQVALSFSEIDNSFSPRAMVAYTGMLNGLRAQFGSARVEGPQELSTDKGPNPAMQGAAR